MRVEGSVQKTTVQKTAVQKTTVQKTAVQKTGMVWQQFLLVAVGLLILAGVALAQPIPTSVLTLPEAPKIGEPMSFTVAFDNAAADPNDAGYGPFLDLIFPVNGIDGAAGADVADGIDFVAATYLGSPVNAQVFTFPDDDGLDPGTTGCVEHPYEVDMSHTHAQVCGTAGDKLVVLQVPFGSFVPDQPTAALTVEANLSLLADLGTPLTIQTRAGFQFGADSLDNACCDPTIVEVASDPALWPSQPTTPSLISMAKVYLGPEDETATGPNFPREYRLTVDIADGQTVTDLDIVDRLPPEFEFVRVVSSSPAATATLPAASPGNPPDNALSFNIASVTGTTATDDVEIVFEFFVAGLDANSQPVLDPATGDDATSGNFADATGDWTPLDGRDMGGTDNATAIANGPGPGPAHTLEDQSIAIQKSVAVVVDGGQEGPTPGDVLEYTVDLQLSDFFAMSGLLITDGLSDGQHFDASFTPTLSISEHGAASTQAMNAANFTVAPNYTPADPAPNDGTTTLTFRISDELITRGLDGLWIGGCVPAGGTGGSFPDCGTFNGGASLGTLTYRTIIQNEFTDNFPSGDPSIDQGDVLENTILIEGTLHSTTDLSALIATEDDDSAAGVSIAFGSLEKLVYAINGNTTLPDPVEVSPGDQVTYRFRYDLPLASFENLRFADYFPVPTYDATELTTFIDRVDASVPAAGTAKFGPEDTFRALCGAPTQPCVPALTTDGVANTATFTYGSYDQPGAPSGTVDVLFTVTVSPAPFADRLILTNQVRALTGSTNGENSIIDAIVPVTLTQPILSMRKGITGSDSSDGTLDPADGGPVAFPEPGSSDPPFSTPLNTDGLAMMDVDSNLSGVDVGDLMSFAITLENNGSSTKGAFDIQVSDIIPSGLGIPPGSPGLNLRVTRGDGTVIGYNPLGPDFQDSDLFGNGIELVDPSAAEGVCQKANPTSGENIVVITYDLIIESTALPGALLANFASLDQYAGSDGAGMLFNHVADPTNFQDGATIQMATPQISKSIAMVAPQAAGAGRITAGDTITYALDVQLTEGTTPDLVLTDTLPAGLQYLSVSVDDSGYNGTVNLSPTVNVTGTPSAGQTVEIPMGSPVTNTDNVDTNDTFLVFINALVVDDAANDGLPSVQDKTNSIALDFTGNPSAPETATASIDFAEPELALVKTMTATADAGDPLTITLTLTNNGTAPAYDIVVTDVLDSTLFDVSAAVPGTLEAGYSFAFTSPTVTLSADPGTSLAPGGGSAVFTFTADVRDDVTTGSVYTNNADALGDSQDGTVAGERSTSAMASDTVTIDEVSDSNKALTATSESFTTDPRVAIGEVLQYTLAFDIPEGITQADPATPLIEVPLPSGLGYLSGTATLQATVDTSLSAANYLGGAPLPASPTPFEPTLNGATLEFDLGHVTNSDINDGNLEQIVIVLDLLVLNVSGNNRTEELTCDSRITYLNTSGNPQSLSSSDTVRVVEPLPTLTKTASPTTASGGDLITFTLVVENPVDTDTTRGFEPSVVDPLPARYLTPAVTSATLSRGSLDATACASFMGNTLNFDSTCLSAAERYLDPGETLTIVYTATLDPAIAFEEVTTNTADAALTSLPGPNGTASATPGAPDSSTGERTGSGALSELMEMVNDLNGMNAAMVTANRPTLVLLDDTDLQILETTTLTAEITVPTGTTDLFELTLDLPAGLSYTGTPIAITVPPGVTASGSPNTTPAAGTDPIVLDFDMVQNANLSPETITVEFEVEVDDILANQRNTPLDTTATLSYQNASMPLPEDSATVTVREPNLEVTKMITAGATGSDAGDTITYEITFTNTDANGTAYAVHLSDLVLPSELLGAPDGAGAGPGYFVNLNLVQSGGVVLNSDGLTALSTADAIFSTTNSANDTLNWPDFDLPPMASVTITYDVLVANSASAGTTLGCQVDADYNSLADRTGRDGSSPGSDDDDDALLENYRESVSLPVTLDASLAIQKSLVPGQSDSLFTLGEEPIFDVRVDLIEGVTPDLDVIVTMPPSLGFLSLETIIAGHGGLSYDGTGLATEAPAGTVTVDLGNVSNLANGDNADDFFIVRLRSVVLEDPANVDGTMLDCDASAQAASASAGPATQQIQIVEPDLEILVSVDDPVPPLGNEVTVTVTVRHTGDSTSDAFEVVLTDAIPDGLTLVPGSTLGQATADESDPTTPIFHLGAITEAEGEKTFTFRLAVDLDAVVDQGLTLPFDGIYSSLAGDPAEERDYTAMGGTGITPTIPPLFDATKTATLFDDADSSGDPTAGDTLEYTLVVQAGDTALTNATLTDTLPAGTTYVASSLASSKGVVDDALAPTLNVQIGSLAPFESATITLRATVDGGLAAGTVLANQGVIDSDQTVPEPTDSDGVDANGDQPTEVTVGDTAAPSNALYVQKIVSWFDDADGSDSVTPGDTMRYVYLFENRGDTDLTQVTLSDTIGSGLTHVVASESITGAGNSIAIHTGALSVSIPSLGAGETFSASYDVTIDSPLADFDAIPGRETFTCQGQADSDQTEPILTDSNGSASDGMQPTTFTAVDSGGDPAMDHEKRFSLATDANANGEVDAGDTLEYHLTVQNTGAAPGANVRLLDTIPTHTSLVAGSVNTSQGAVLSEDPVSINLGTVDPGAVITVVFRVTVDGGTPAGTVISNQANLTGDNFADEPSDDNGADSDGQNPTLTPVGSGGDSGTIQISKALESSSETASAGTDGLIGEVMTLRSILEIPAGTTRDLRWNETLDTGLRYLPGTARLAPAFDVALTSATNPGGVNSVASGVFAALVDGTDLNVNGQTLELLLGDVINSDSDANAETYVLEIQAVIENAATNQAGTVLTCASQLTYLDGLSQAQTVGPETASLTVIEPTFMAVLTSSPTELTETGGTVTYSLAIVNLGGGFGMMHGADAFNLTMDEQLTAEFTGLTVTQISASFGTAGITDHSSGTQLSITVDHFPEDGSLTLEFEAIAPAILTNGTTLDVDTDLVWTSLPGDQGTGSVTPGQPGDADGERTGSGAVNDHALTASASIPVETPDLVKTVVNPQMHYAIGEQIELRLELILPGSHFGTIETSMIQQILDDGLTYETGSLTITYPAGVTSSTSPADFIRQDDMPTPGEETLSLDLGVLTNANPSRQTVTLDFLARVDNQTTNQDGQTLGCAADFLYDDPAGGTVTRSQAVSATVGEPHLDLVKTLVGNSSGLIAGETLSFEVELTNDGTVTAYDVLAQMPTSVDLENVANLIVSNSSGGAETPILSDSGTSWTSTPFDLPVGASVTITFDADIAAVRQPADQFECQTIASFTSLDGSDAAERDGSSPSSDQDDNSLLNNYNASAQTPTITVGRLDYGDAPDPSYPTLLTSDGARHVEIAGIHLGATIDNEPDGQANASEGDDLNGDDEDGIDFVESSGVVGTSLLVQGDAASELTIIASTAGRLDAWVDFDGDGMFEPAEQIFTSEVLAAGSQTLSFAVPAMAVTGPTHSRFRFSTMGGLMPTGLTLDGEVEDHPVEIVIPATAGERVWDDVNGDGIQDAGEPGLPGVTVELFSSLGVPVGSTLTDASGNFSFTDLLPGDYYAVFTAPAGYVPSPADATSDDLDSDVISPAGQTDVFTLTSDQDLVDLDAGFTLDSDGDGVSDAMEGMGDRDGDGILDAMDYDPAGYLYDETTGEILPDGHVSISGPGAINLILDGTTGEYQWFTDGTPGIYTMTVTPPIGYRFSDVCLPSDPPAFDPTGMSEPVVLGDGEDGSTGFLMSNTCTTHYYTFDVTAGDPFIFNNNIPLQETEICLAVADSDKLSNSDQLVLIDVLTGQSSPIGPLGTLDVEAAALALDGRTLYAVDGGQLGTVDLRTGAFTARPNPLGTADGAAGSVLLSDVDGLTVDPLSNVLYGVHRTDGPDTPDLLVQIDPATGTFVADAFGPGIDYVEIGLLLDLESIDDIAIDPTDGQMYGVANDDPTGYFDRLVQIDKTTGAITDVGAFGILDVEGLSFDNVGNLQASTGSDSTFSARDRIYSVDKATGAVTLIAPILNSYTDYEGLACLSSGSNEIAGTVYNDADLDGLYDEPGEIGQDAVTVNLYLDVNNDGMVDPGDVLIQTTTTDANGDYSFIVGAADSFVVDIDPASLPTAGILTTDNIEEADFTDFGNTDPDNDFGFVISASLGDTVWDDWNADGIQDAGEPGIPGVTVELLDAGGSILTTTMTDASGNYLFDNLLPVDYSVRVIAPPSYLVSPQDQGMDEAADSDIDTATGETATVSLNQGETYLDLDAGLYLPASVSDLIFEDIDGDGLQGPGDPGIPNVTVELLDAGGMVLATTTTDVAGNYVFSNLTPGDYAIRVTPPAGMTFTRQDEGADDASDSDVDPATGETALFNLISGENDTSQDAGLYVPTEVGDRVFEDVDGDGIQDVFDPSIAGVVVELLAADLTPIAMTMTDANGNYSFTNLPPGDYVIAFTPPVGFSFSPPRQGSDDTLDSNPVLATGLASITLESGDVDPTIDAGMIAPPTEVGLSDVSACVGDRGETVLVWRTDSQVATVGFWLDVQGRDAQRFAPVESLLTALPQAGGASYYFPLRDRRAGEPVRFRLSELESTGQTRHVGVFDVEAETACDIRAVDGYVRAPRAIPDDQQRRLERHRQAQRQSAVERSRRTGQTVKIAVEETGLYRVTADAIAQVLSLPVDRVRQLIDRQNLRLSRAGQDVAWHADETGHGLIFVGRAIDSRETRRNVYLLETGRGLAMADATSAPASAARLDQSFPHSKRFEEERLALPHLPQEDSAGQDFWYWTTLDASPLTPSTERFDIPLERPHTAQPASLEVELRGATHSRHRVIVQVNGETIGDVAWDGTDPVRASLDLPAHLLREGDNAVDLNAILEPGEFFSVFHLEGFTLTYERFYQLDDAPLTFQGGSNRTITLYGTGEPALAVYDLSDPDQPRRVRRYRLEGDSRGFQLSFRPDFPETPYLAARATRNPAAVWAATQDDLLLAEGGAEYILIAGEGLLQAARGLADLRESEGLSTRVVGLEAIYDRFGHGIEDPEAIRRFLEHASTRWQIPARYTTLIGDGSYDPLDHLGLGGQAVPVTMIETPYGLFASDLAYVDFNGDRVADLPIGRLPVLLAEELETYIERQEQSTNAKVSRLVAVADYPDAAGDFPADSDAVIGQIPSHLDAQTIDLSQLGLNTARDQLRDAFEHGSTWINYIGHSSFGRFSDRGVLTREDVHALAVSGNAPLVSAWTCASSRFAVPGPRALGETLILEPGSTVVSAVGLSQHEQAMVLAREFYRQLARPNARVGDALLLALRSLARQDAARTDMLQIYQILGESVEPLHR